MPKNGARLFYLPIISNRQSEILQKSLPLVIKNLAKRQIIKTVSPHHARLRPHRHTKNNWRATARNTAQMGKDYCKYEF